MEVTGAHHFRFEARDYEWEHARDPDGVELTVDVSIGAGSVDGARVQCRIPGRDRPVSVGGVSGPLPDVRRRAELQIWTGWNDRVPGTYYLAMFTEPIVSVRADFEDGTSVTQRGADADGLLVAGGVVPADTGLAGIVGLNRSNEIVEYGRR
ncbi:hypothetical protein [Pengzhenrongella sp.]|jgi:hypothetical protein|uniref:hypothetical protein n=1 Tax=Pengzhenrongella sp. TaxID=2888820 RepID=UPI002F931903